MVGTYFPGRGTLIEETYLKGKAKGKAESIVCVLRHRGIQVSPLAEGTISGCRDIDTLDRWLGRALTATRVQDLLAGE